MDSLDLLAREDEFKKLNKQLEKKTESLMKEIEHVMQKQDIFSEFSQTLNLNYNKKKHNCEASSTSPSQNQEKKIAFKKRTQLSNNETKIGTDLNDSALKSHINDRTEENCVTNLVCDCCRNKNGISNDYEFLYAFISINVKENVFPQSFLKDKITVEGVCKFLSSKVKLLQEQIDKLQSTIDKKASQCESHLTQLAELESERLTLLNRTNNMKCSTVEIKAKYMALQNRFNDKDRLYKEQRSETDKLTAEVKRLRSRNVSLEAKFVSQDETIENLKSQLENTRKAEKEFRDSSRSLSASHETAILRLEARTKTLTSCIDKQAALIDNLKKQNALLMTEGAVTALEKEYCKFLSQDFK